MLWKMVSSGGRQVSCTTACLLELQVLWQQSRQKQCWIAFRFAYIINKYSQCPSDTSTYRKSNRHTGNGYGSNEQECSNVPDESSKSWGEEIFWISLGKVGKEATPLVAKAAESKCHDYGKYQNTKGIIQ